MSHFVRHVGVNFSTCRAKSKMPAKVPASQLSRQVSPTMSHFVRHVGVNFSTCRAKSKMPAKVPASQLSRQVSNLNSFDPESDKFRMLKFLVLTTNLF
jgi:hypothetical protein